MYATLTPSPMSVNMFRLRKTTDCTARTKNGHAAHTHTGVAKASSKNIRVRVDIQDDSGRPGSMSPMTDRTSGTVKAAARENRRVISPSSGLSSSSPPAVRSSSAMPQTGQVPGRSRTTSGGIGHVHSWRAAGATGVTGVTAFGACWP